MKQTEISKPRAIFAALLLACFSLNASANAMDFYVSPSGSDKNSGTLEEPFATIAHAQTVVRKHTRTSPGEGVTVFLRGGKYYLTQPVVFTADDGGSAEAPVVYTAYQDEVPQVLGGEKLDGLKWVKHNDNVYKTKVPQGLVFETLFVNGQQQILARYPNYTQDAPAFNGVAADALSKERVATWEDPTYGYFHAMHKACLLYTSPSPRDKRQSRMPSSA